MKREDKISLTFLVIFILGLSNLILILAIKFFNLFLTTTQIRILFLIILLFSTAMILSSKEKILKNKYYNYFKKQISLFLETFREWKMLLKGVIIDALTLLSIILIAFLAVRFVSWNFSFLEQVPGMLAAVQSYSQTGSPMVNEVLQKELQKNSPGIKNAMVFSGIGIAVAYLLTILSIGFFQGLLYSGFTKQNFDKKFIKKFSILNSILIVSFTLLVILTAVMAKTNIAAYTIIFLSLLFFYLALILFALFDKKEKILRTIKSSLKFAFEKIHLFFTPFILAYICIIILLFTIGFLNSILPPQSIIYTSIIYISLIIFFITWLKFFTTKVVRGIKNE